jgi:serine/threonine-protein kinase
MVCPRCRKKWPEAEAPTVCPTDGLALVRPRDLVDIGDDPMVGRTLEGRYTILAKLGAGSMGTVYRAKQHAMGREVAIKILRGDRAVDDSAKARFMREARANSLLASPNTVTVFDFGQSENGEFYLARELLEGESLGQRLTRVGRLPAPLAVDACRQALRSLGEAHAKGIIHRDLKPDNLFFARVLTSAAIGPTAADPDSHAESHDEIVKVLDFGIAKMINADDPNPMSVVETQAGTVFGTPRYMSPEQAQGKPLDARSDLYSLAVILYQMLTGRPPFTDNDAVVVMARHIKSTPKRPNEAVPEAMIPTELEDVIMRTLAKDPKDRPGSAEILAGELLAALEAQGAQTSGVRASITNAAGIRVPDSMRPPPMSLPPPPKRKTVAGIPIPLIAAAVPVIVLELLHGDSLYEHYSTNGPLEWKRVVNIARQVCESLEEAHAQGIVHRDLKPTNIHLERVGGDPDFVKVLDFGIAKILMGSDFDASEITNAGTMIGTLDYMSPEQMVGGQITGQTDIYTLGIVMYEMIAGTRPFPESSTAGAALAAMLKTTPEPLYLRAPIPEQVSAIVMRCLERETSRRYRSVHQLREDLERIATDGAAASN